MKYLLTLSFSLFISTSAFSIITYEDNRRLITSDESEIIQAQSKAIFTFFEKDKLIFENGFYRFKSNRTHQEYLNLCDSESFLQQPAPAGFCTGFLIEQNIGMTAGHCVVPEPENFCKNHYIVFDYVGGQQQFTNKQVYECQSILSAVNYREDRQIPDHAIIKFFESLNRPIMELESSDNIYNGMEVYTIGHPKGLPQIIADQGEVIFTDNPLYFSVQVDTFRGNSGGPIIDESTGKVVGIISHYQGRHPNFSDYDYHTNASGCDKPIIQNETHIAVGSSKLDIFLSE